MKTNQQQFAQAQPYPAPGFQAPQGFGQAPGYQAPQQYGQSPGLGGAPQQGQIAFNTAKQNQGFAVARPDQLPPPGTAQGKKFRFAVLCCLCAKDAPAGEFLKKTFLVHMIFYTIGLIATIGLMFQSPVPVMTSDGEERKNSSSGFFINLAIVLILVGLNFGAYLKAKANEFSALLNLTTILNCVMDVLATIGYAAYGIITLLFSLLISSLVADSDGSEDPETEAQIKKVKRFAMFLIILSIFFFILMIFMISLIVLSCTACDAAKDLKENQQVRKSTA